MTEVIGCGISGTRMNAWLKGAFTEEACWDAPIGTLPAGTVVIGLFDRKEITTLVDFIQSEFVQPQ